MPLKPLQAIAGAFCFSAARDSQHANTKLDWRLFSWRRIVSLAVQIGFTPARSNAGWLFIGVHMAGDDLSAIAGPGLQTQEDLYAEAMDEIIQMASALCDAIALLHDLDGGSGSALTVLVDNDGRLAAVVMSPCDGDEPRFALDLVDQGASIH